jgi:hypothetical protein
MNEPEIFARLAALNAALVHKLGAQPWLPAAILIETDVRLHIRGLRKNGGMPDTLLLAKGASIATVLAEAEAFVAAMPDPEKRAVTEWHRKLGNVIDEGHALALPDDVMRPLRQGSRAMTENLLAAPEVAA